MARQLTSDDSRLLFFALGANGVFSTLSGLAMALASRPIAQWLGLAEPAWILGTGILLVVFGASLLVHWRRRRVSRAEAVAISAMDLGWVVGTAVLLILWPSLFSEAGVSAVIGVAVVVLVFFELQALALWRTRQSG